ncbi:hypothetical protein HFC70_19200 [Agrobacterium sp. a22-2]|uniref:hypothetical protein n=1 Tax=Agrobacterium sp. a22-2 TaxID=2283840 RepID=UPI00144622C2|nr:hypothetical protein [Agrobacterium sp. a22-2]NKN38479.1 hypothetical protein [Agrobacterium sp. a22-2]
MILFKVLSSVVASVTRDLKHRERLGRQASVIMSWIGSSRTVSFIRLHGSRDGTMHHINLSATCHLILIAGQIVDA